MLKSPPNIIVELSISLFSSVSFSFIYFYLKSVLFDISIAISDLFCLLFGWNLFFQPFIFNKFGYLDKNWVSFRQHIVGSFFFLIYFANLCLLIEEFNSFIFKVITRKGFCHLLFVFYMSYLFLHCSSTNAAFFCVSLTFSNVLFWVFSHFLNYILKSFSWW